MLLVEARPGDVCLPCQCWCVPLLAAHLLNHHHHHHSSVVEAQEKAAIVLLNQHATTTLYNLSFACRSPPSRRGAARCTTRQGRCVEQVEGFDRIFDGPSRHTE
ncbi:hypothetical protein BHM03_00008027 [Ensete ventricosum]|nr:hypothetical protein BHM03_00008027 [Ensete ventricosum]